MSDTNFEETLRRIERKLDALFVSLERLTDATKETTEHLERLINAKTEYVVGADPSESIDFGTILDKADSFFSLYNYFVEGLKKPNDDEHFVGPPTVD